MDNINDPAVWVKTLDVAVFDISRQVDFKHLQVEIDVRECWLAHIQQSVKELTLRLTGVCKHHAKEKHIFVPETWWDHVKLTLRERFPWLCCCISHPRLRSITTKFVHTHFCPHIRTTPRQTHLQWVENDDCGTKDTEDITYAEYQSLLETIQFVRRLKTEAGGEPTIQRILGHIDSFYRSRRRFYGLEEENDNT